MSETEQAIMTPRRGFLRGLASLPLIGGGVTIGAFDPAVRLYTEATDARSIVNDAKVSDETSDRAYDRLCELEMAMVSTRAQTVAGAVASLEWAAADFRRFFIDASPAMGEELILALLDSAMGVLKKQLLLSAAGRPLS